MCLTISYLNQWVSKVFWMNHTHTHFFKMCLLLMHSLLCCAKSACLCYLLMTKQLQTAAWSSTCFAYMFNLLASPGRIRKELWNPGELLPLSADNPELDGPILWLSRRQFSMYLHGDYNPYPLKGWQHNMLLVFTWGTVFDSVEKIFIFVTITISCFYSRDQQCCCVIAFSAMS